MGVCGCVGYGIGVKTVWACVVYGWLKSGCVVYDMRGPVV